MKMGATSSKFPAPSYQGEGKWAPTSDYRRLE